jgi:hypothetical protein
VIVCPAALCLLSACGPRWITMWALAFGIYAGLKWLTLAESSAARNANLVCRLAYLVLWPGMDADAFLDRRRHVEVPSLREWLSTAANLAVGIGLLTWAVRRAHRFSAFVAGWFGLVAICFLLHFGLFKLLSLVWRHLGFGAVAIMDAPYRAASLGEFWGRRWNLAFRDLAHEFIFRPLVRMRGTTVATGAVFLASGLVHDIVISGGAGAGFGGPTLYFLIQAAALFVERTRVGKRLGLGRGRIGRLFCGVVTLTPIAVLFHRPFIERCVVPTLVAFGLITRGGPCAI